MARETRDTAGRNGVVKEGGTTSERSAQCADAIRNRTTILEAIRQLVTEQDAEVTMGETVRATGVAVGTLYRHFPNRTGLLATVVSEYVEALADNVQGTWGCVESGQAEADQELLGFLERALEVIAHSYAAKTVVRTLGAEVEYAESGTRATGALGRPIEAGRSSGRLWRNLIVSDPYILMVFYLGDGSVEVRRRWLELTRPGLFGDGQ